MATHVKRTTVVDIWQSALDNGLDFQQPMSGLFTSLRQTGQQSPKIFANPPSPLYFFCFTDDSYRKPWIRGQIVDFNPAIPGSNHLSVADESDEKKAKL